jgi:hypothetical protein
MISAEVSHKRFKTDSDAERDLVRGTFVSGLTAADMRRIDIFESEVGFSSVHKEIELIPLSL